MQRKLKTGHDIRTEKILKLTIEHFVAVYLHATYFTQCSASCVRKERRKRCENSTKKFNEARVRASRGNNKLQTKCKLIKQLRSDTMLASSPRAEMAVGSIQDSVSSSALCTHAAASMWDAQRSEMVSWIN